MRTFEVAAGVTVLERGWLHSSTVVLSGDTPALIDTGYHTGAAELIARIQDLGRFPVTELAHILLTHVHSDHAGGCAALSGASRARVAAHRDCRALIDAWDPRRLWLEGRGQELPRFPIHDTLEPGHTWTIDRIEWQVMATPGHAVGGISLYAPEARILVSGDALWHNGFGVLDLHLEGEETIDLAARALADLAALDVALVIPGHGPPFTDYRGALVRARRTLDGYRHDRPRTLARNLRSMMAFWLLANDGAPRAALEHLTHDFLAAEPLLVPPGRSIPETAAEVIEGLVAAGIMRQDGERVHPGERLNASAT